MASKVAIIVAMHHVQIGATLMLLHPQIESAQHSSYKVEHDLSTAIMIFITTTYLRCTDRVLSLMPGVESPFLLDTVLTVEPGSRNEFWNSSPRATE